MRSLGRADSMIEAGLGRRPLKNCFIYLKVLKHFSVLATVRVHTISGQGDVGSKSSTGVCRGARQIVDSRLDLLVESMDG
jgi:hypothetical protein